MRWGLAAILLLVVAPLVGFAGVSLRQQRSADTLTCTARVMLPAQVQADASGWDRRGWHLAVVLSDGYLRLLRTTDGRVTAQRLPLPWTGDALYRLRVDCLDANHDGLIDVCVRPRSVEGIDFGPPQLHMSWCIATYLQRAGGFQLTSIGHQSGMPRSLIDSSAVVADTVLYVPRTETQGPDRLGFTSLVRVYDRRVCHRLQGAFVASVDLDNDGNHDVLTLTGFDSEQSLADYRLYLYRQGRYRVAWEGSFQHPLDPRRPLRQPHVGDFDHDGLPELVFIEPARARLSIWAYRAAAPARMDV